MMEKAVALSSNSLSKCNEIAQIKHLLFLTAVQFFMMQMILSQTNEWLTEDKSSLVSHCHKTFFVQLGLSQNNKLSFEDKSFLELTQRRWLLSGLKLSEKHIFFLENTSIGTEFLCTFIVVST